MGIALFRSVRSARQHMKFPGVFRTLMRRVANNDPLLTCLDLRVFHLGPDGAADLARALRVNNTIEILNLWVNHIGDQGMAVLAPVIASHPTIVSVDVFKNDIGDN